jgi:hypothetical protein
MRRATEIPGYDHRKGCHERIPRRVWRKRIARLFNDGCRSRWIKDTGTGIFDARGELVIEIYWATTQGQRH